MRSDHIFWLLHVKSFFTWNPGHFECYAEWTLVSVILIWRMLRVSPCFIYYYFVQAINSLLFQKQTADFICLLCRVVLISTCAYLQLCWTCTTCLNCKPEPLAVCTQNYGVLSSDSVCWRILPCSLPLCALSLVPEN